MPRFRDDGDFDVEAFYDAESDRYDGMIEQRIIDQQNRRERRKAKKTSHKCCAALPRRDIIEKKGVKGNGEKEFLQKADRKPANQTRHEAAD